MAPDIIAGKRQHRVSFVYRSYHLPMPDDVLLVVNCNFNRIYYGTVFETFTLKDRKLLIEPTHPLFDAPARETP